MDHPPLIPLADALWIMNGDRVRMLGIPFSTRAAIVRLGDGTLWMWSPVKPTAARVAAIEALGTVAHIVAPNKFHYLSVASWQERYPAVKTWAGPGLAKRRPELRFDAELGDGPPTDWRDEIDQLIFGGSRVLPEAVFLHRASRTLLVTDIIQNHDPAEEPRFWRWVKRVNGILAPDGGTPRDWRLTVRDRELARRARDRVLAWDFDRLVVTHGRCVETGAHAHVERAFSWLD